MLSKKNKMQQQNDKVLCPHPIVVAFNFPAASNICCPESQPHNSQHEWSHELESMNNTLETIKILVLIQVCYAEPILV